LFAAVGIILFLAGAAIGAYDGVRWLRTGRVRPVTVEQVVSRRLPPTVTKWLARPGTWVGLRDVTVWVLHVPFYAFALFVGFVILVASAV
jgi:hypothetical protein